ncbi:replication protein RepA [Fibrella forsythiae]|uniref:Plasmid encoded RepA protein n=1 Tax=Fibrella forsythiae TaxID=2817061 RepID=A0ABS3JSH3_9BACT|nr:replication protein RepA [Fibrella forsythiae]MBO0952959.1 plasmid encoded RepA protein [Fibrella forsythiae]
MTDKKQDLSKVAKRRSKLVYESFQEEPDDRELLFQAAAMCHTFFPRREPEQEPHKLWKQQSGKFVLYITPMAFPDPLTGEETYSGLPYGPKARVLLANLNTIAIQKQTRTIEIANNPAKFLKDIGLTDGGNQLEVIQDQMHRLANCVLRTFYLDEQEETGDTVPIITRTKRTQWTSQITLSQEYFKHLSDHPVPLAKTHLAALSNNATALDLYCFLAHRLHRIPDGKPQFLAWKTIYDQFGGDYDRIRAFRSNFVKVWKLVHSVYTDARIEEKGTKGLLLYHSAPPIPKVQIISGLH